MHRSKTSMSLTTWLGSRGAEENLFGRDMQKNTKCLLLSWASSLSSKVNNVLSEKTDAFLHTRSIKRRGTRGTWTRSTPYANTHPPFWKRSQRFCGNGRLKLTSNWREKHTQCIFTFDTLIRKIGFCPERDSNPRLPDQGDVSSSPAQGRNQFFGWVCRR